MTTFRLTRSLLLQLQHLQTEVKWSEVTQLCPTLCDPMDCSLLRSSIHGTFQTRVLEWVAISFSRGSSPPKNRNCLFLSPSLADGFFTTVSPGKPLKIEYLVSSRVFYLLLVTLLTSVYHSCCKIQFIICKECCIQLPRQLLMRIYGKLNMYYMDRW